MQQGITLILQIIALVCFFIAGMNWQLPKTSPKNWFAFAWLFVFLSFMLSGIALTIHTINTH